jgi:hypothetical protein
MQRQPQQETTDTLNADKKAIVNAIYQSRGRAIARDPEVTCKRQKFRDAMQSLGNKCAPYLQRSEGRKLVLFVNLTK